MSLCDTHTHSKFSFDSELEIDALCLKAIENNVGILSITDHFEAMENEKDFKEELSLCSDQQRAIDKAKKKYHGKLKLLEGIELGQPHFNANYAKSIFTQFNFDYVIGSLHFLKGGRDLYFLEYTKDNKDSLLKEYFDAMLEMVKFGGFNSLGHIDYIMRCMKSCFDDKPTFKGYEKIIREILTEAANKNIAIEINTKGLHDWFKDLGVELWLLKIFKEVGGKYVTIGSDAHDLEFVGYGYKQAENLIKSAGFDGYTYFESGVPNTVKF